jgi:hypothetical protein
VYFRIRELYFILWAREDGGNAFKIVTGKSTGKRPLGRPRHRITLEWILKK